MCYCTSLYLEPEPNPFWKDSVLGFRRLSKKELALYSSSVDWSKVAEVARKAAAAPQQPPTSPTAAAAAGGAAERGTSIPAAGSPTAFVDGYSFNTIVCEGRLYLDWLVDQIKAAGGKLQQRQLSHISELEYEGWDLVVNCCGLGSKDVMSDPYCYPIRGQIVKVRAPWITQCVFAAFPDETAYIIPNREWVVLGGTGQVGDWNLNASLTDAEGILDRCSQVLPSLKQAQVLSQWVGLRPGRVRLRLEAGKVTGGAVQSIGFEEEETWTVEGADQNGSMAVVSNYGHGGSGLTLAWGTAGDAVEIAAAQLAKKGLGAGLGSS
jgi:glycine/D-amino acid oxidase-like deaminating enzyme